MEDALRAVLAEERDLPRRPMGFPVAGYLEAHIEQGIRLQEEGCAVGVVTGIQGKRTFRVEIIGEESHAGTTPRSVRRDALTSAVAVVDALQKAMWDEADAVRFTIGMFEVTPNAPSVVPGRVVFSIDLRHGEEDVVESLGNIIPKVCGGRIAEGARLRCASSSMTLPCSSPEDVRARIGNDRGAGLAFAHGTPIASGPRLPLPALRVSNRDDLHPLQGRHQPQRGGEHRRQRTRPPARAYSQKSHSSSPTNEQGSRRCQIAAIAPRPGMHRDVRPSGPQWRRSSMARDARAGALASSAGASRPDLPTASSLPPAPEDHRREWTL